MIMLGTEKTLIKMRSHPVMGDWHRDRQIRIRYKIWTIIWTYSEGDMLSHKITIPVGITGLMVKNQTAFGRSWNSLFQIQWENILTYWVKGYSSVSNSQLKLCFQVQKVIIKSATVQVCKIQYTWVESLGSVFFFFLDLKPSF